MNTSTATRKATAAQTPRQRIRTALSHVQPHRVPFSWGFCATPEMSKTLETWLAGRGLDWAKLRAAASDKIGAGPQYVGPPLPGGNQMTGLWGIRLKNADYGNGVYQEFTDFPLAGYEDPKALDDYPWPDPQAYDYAGVRDQVLKANADTERAVQFSAGNPFEIYSWMTGIEEALINLAANPDLVIRALDHITTFFETRLRLTLESAGDLIDLVFFADDLGSQSSLLMSLDTYRRVLRPFHQRIIQTVRRHAPHAYSMMHSDGAVADVLPDLIEIGLDALEAVQTDAQGMAPERLKASFGQRLSFHGGISVQQLLPRSDAATVERECRRLVEVFGEKGGYIAAPSHAIQMGTPPENVLAMLRGVLGEEDYGALLEQAAL